MSAPVLDPVLPPFSTRAADGLPQGPEPGSPESGALAAWEVLTRARLSRSTGSARMSLLGAYERAGQPLTRENALRMALHAFEGSEDRWACRRARAPAMDDADLLDAVVQEMGGPADGPQEMTTLGFWSGDSGFFFDSRGPAVVICELSRGPTGVGSRIRHRRLAGESLLAAARRVLGIARAAGRTRVVPSPAVSRRRSEVPPSTPTAASAAQLSLL